MNQQASDFMFQFFDNIFSGKNMVDGDISERLKDFCINKITDELDHLDVDEFDTYDVEDNNINMYFYVVNFNHPKDWNIEHSPYAILTLDTSTGEIIVGEDHH